MYWKLKRINFTSLVYVRGFTILEKLFSSLCLKDMIVCKIILLFNSLNYNRPLGKAIMPVLILGML
jgi:hypothetical protein